MTFDLATFLFQLVNFLVLVAVLHRLLWKPLLHHMTDRREKIATSLDDIVHGRAEVAASRTEVAAALKEAKQALVEARERAEREANEHRSKLIESAKQAATEERDRAMATVAAEQLRRESEFLDSLAPTVGRAMLSLIREVGGDLDRRACETFVRSLHDLSPSEKQELQQTAPTDVARVECATDAPDRGMIDALHELLGGTRELEVVVDADLVAGARLVVGDVTIDGSIRAQVEQLLAEVGHARDTRK